MEDEKTKGRLEQLGIKSLNEMQIKMSDAVPNHQDIVLLSPTGSGKTVAFLLPLLEKLTSEKHIQALVLVPSRELAILIVR